MENKRNKRVYQEAPTICKKCNGRELRYESFVVGSLGDYHYDVNDQASQLLVCGDCGYTEKDCWIYVGTVVDFEE